MYAYVLNNPLRSIDLYGLIDQENDTAHAGNNTNSEQSRGESQRPYSSSFNDRHSESENSSLIDYSSNSMPTTGVEPSPTENQEDEEDSTAQTVKEHIISSIINATIRAALGILEKRLGLPSGMLTGSYGLVKATQSKTSANPKNKAGKTFGQKNKTHQIQKDKQNKHVPGAHNYQPGRSVLEHPDPQKLVDKYAGTGRAVNDVPKGHPGYKEKVNFNEYIGYDVDPTTQQQTRTTWGVIHYAKDGVHIVPDKP